MRAAQRFNEFHRAAWSEKPRRPAWKQAKAKVGTGKANDPIPTIPGQNHAAALRLFVRSPRP